MADAPQVVDIVADAPEVAHAEPCPELVDNQPRPALPHDHKLGNHPQDFHYDGSVQPRTIFGLRKHYVYIFSIVALLLVGAIIGGSVGGVAAVQKKNAGTNAPLQACITSFNTMSGRVIDSVSPTLTSTTFSQPSSSSFADSSAIAAPDPFSRYSPPVPTSVFMIETACLYNKARSFSGNTFNCNYNTDINQLGDLNAIVAYSVQTCVDACSKFNEVTRTSACVAVTLVETLAAEYVKQGADCFLKNITGPAARQSGVMLAVMDKK